jgi:hypothetical protein
MDTTTTEGEVIDTTTNGTEGEGETITIKKSDYDKTNQTLGSLKRELKDLKKPKEDTKETVQTKTDENALLQKLERISLRQAGLDHADDIALARQTAEKWKMDIDEVLSDPDFKAKLERQQTDRTNTLATSGVRGTAGKGGTKDTSEYWIAKGVPPTPADIPDRATRAKVVRAVIDSQKNGGKTFYND